MKGITNLVNLLSDPKAVRHWFSSYVEMMLDASTLKKAAVGRIRQLCGITALRGSAVTSDRQQDSTVYPPPTDSYRILPTEQRGDLKYECV